MGRGPEDESDNFADNDGFHGWVCLQKSQEVVGSAGAEGFISVTLGALSG